MLLSILTFFLQKLLLHIEKKKRENGFNYRTIKVRYKALKHIVTNIDFEIFLPESAVFHIFIASSVLNDTAVFCTKTSN